MSTYLHVLDARNLKLRKVWTQVSSLQSLVLSSAHQFEIADWKRQAKIRFRFLSNSWLELQEAGN